MIEFKDQIGRYITKGLFKETITSDHKKIYTPPYTLKDYHTETEKSLYLLYMSYDDPTEYQFAKDWLGGWAHWQKLCATTWFAPIVAEWREEMEIKLRSKGVLAMAELAVSGKESAAKWLAEGGFKGKRQAGRPTKEEKAGELKKQSRLRDDLKADMERLGIEVH